VMGAVLQQSRGRATVWDEHEAIAGAIAAGDGARAERLIADHGRRASDNLAAQLAQFDREGYLFFPGQFTPQETKLLNDAVPALYARREVYNVREKGKDAVRTNFAAHLYS